MPTRTNRQSASSSAPTMVKSNSRRAVMGQHHHLADGILLPEGSSPNNAGGSANSSVVSDFGNGQPKSVLEALFGGNLDCDSMGTGEDFSLLGEFNDMKPEDFMNFSEVRKYLRTSFYLLFMF